MSEIRLDEEVRRRINGLQEPLQPARHLGAVARRAQLVEQLLSARQEIAQIFIDIEQWNEHVRKPDEARVEADPNGDLKLLAAFYDRILKNDVQ